MIFILMPIIQLVGAFTAIHFFLRMQAANGLSRTVWLVLSSLIAGSSGFTAHFMTIAAVPPGDQLILDPQFAVISFLISMGTIGTGIILSRLISRRFAVFAFGTIFFLLATLANFCVLLSAQVQGEITYHPAAIVAALGVSYAMAMAGSVIAAAARGMVAGCIGGIFLGFMTPVQDAIILSGVTIDYDFLAPMPVGVTSDITLIGVFISATLILLLVGGTGLLLERSFDRQAKAEYRELAFSDPLTGLRNRTGFSTEVKGTFAHSWRQGANDAVLVVDLDKFKTINDVYGHPAGDAVLKTVAERMRATLPESAVIARVGGDEFVAYLPEDNSGKPQPDPVALADDLLDALSQPLEFENKTLNMGGSIGVALRTEATETPQYLFAAADIALYRSKDKRGQVTVYNPDMGAEMRKRTQTEIEMRRALERDEFVLYFQPQVDLLNWRISGFEALVRWEHPEKGLLLPGTFIPIAEESNLITDLGKWVLFEACHIASGWPERYGVSVNVAARQLALPDFVEQVQDALWNSGLAANRLEIELTEASVIEDEAQALSVMQALRRSGVRIAMDDYGTGYASLSTLRKFPFDKLKIDRSFVDSLTHDPQSAAIIRSTLLLSKALSLPVIAEGVETQQHVEFLISEGCVNLQGYFFGKPMSREQVVGEIIRDSTEIDAKAV